MSSAGRRLYSTDSDTPKSSTNLLQSSPTGSTASVQATFAQGPQLRTQVSTASVTNGSAYSAVMSSKASVAPSISDKFSLAPDPSSWGSRIEPNHAEPDDWLHNPDPRRDRKLDKGGTVFTTRGLANLGCLFVLVTALIGLFAGYPLVRHFTDDDLSTLGGFNIGGINMSGQIPDIGNFGLIDKDTPAEAYTRTSYVDGSTMELVFSDEFNVDGRSFYPGDDPYWEAVDLRYWGTNNLEWYDPEAITTQNGSLVITLDRRRVHDLDYQGGMMSTWNKFCFTGGILEASVVLPGDNQIAGLWPAFWAMGNLGRAGYGASLDGLWPYTYDACDVGTVANQTKDGLPLAATVNGDESNGGALSFLPGQRLSRCTCPGESHPGPMHSDGTYVGRAAPEIDVFEAQVGDGSGHVSQSGQWAPFNAGYQWSNTSDHMLITDPLVTHMNTYQGAAYQQATSCVATTNQQCYELTGGCYSIYAFEYRPGFDDAYIAWVNDGEVSWRMNAGAVGPDPRVEISARPVPQEPMYIILNLGISRNFGFVDEENLVFPTHMYVDWIRVYQNPDQKNLGCDPPDFPTQAYINQYIEAYTNPNLTTWVDDYKQQIPKNSFLDEC